MVNVEEKLNEILIHIREKKAFYWGKSERIYLFYDSQEVLLLQLFTEMKGAK